MAANKILIVDDDVRVAAMLLDLLAGEGFDPAHAFSGAVARGRLLRFSFDLVILDAMMEKRDALELLRCLRQHGQMMPVLMLTARGDEEDGILGLELGADDYLSKPFRARELVARLRAILRRSGGSGPMEPASLTLGELAIDPGARSATMEGVPVRLTAAEFLVLEALARSAGRVQSRATLTYQALGRRLEPFDRSIDTHVSNIRRKLCLDPGRSIEIRSLRGHGYVLVAHALLRAASALLPTPLLRSGESVTRPQTSGPPGRTPDPGRLESRPSQTAPGARPNLPGYGH